MCSIQRFHPSSMKSMPQTWNLSSFGAQHTRRSGNVAAHTCARHASNTQGVIWMNDPPNFLLQQLNADCNQSV
jgi:hypothetical protein